ncbi:MAG: hypothetical protein KC931_17685, partial [Candidatus Omnitrophica bacterium]|nr:hypothetical protein [Candidatus Omnitrophota bacterium]
MMKKIFWPIICSLLVWTPVALGQETPSDEQVSAAIDQLLQVGPDQIANSLKEMKSQVGEWDKQVVDLRGKADNLEAQAKEISERVESLRKLLEKFAKGAEVPKPQPEAVAMQGAAPMGNTEMASMSAEKQEPVISYVEHIRPIFQANCFSCHNRD